MKVSAASRLVPSPTFPDSRRVVAPRKRRAFFVALFAVVLACLALFTAAADENWREPAGSEWSIVGGDWHNSRYSTLNRVNTQTVGRMGGAWTSQKFDAGTSRATPVVKDGVMFVTAGASVYALNARTGETIWQHGQRPAGGGRRGSPHPDLGTPGVAGARAGRRAIQGRGRARRWIGLRRTGRRPGDRAQGKDRRARLEPVRRRHAGGSRSGGRRARRRMPQASCSSASMPIAGSAVRRSRSTRRPDGRSGSSMSFPVQESPATRRGPRTTIRGKPAAARSG